MNQFITALKPFLIPSPIFENKFPKNEGIPLNQFTTAKNPFLIPAPIPLMNFLNGSHFLYKSTKAVPSATTAAITIPIGFADITRLRIF